MKRHKVKDGMIIFLFSSYIKMTPKGEADQYCSLISVFSFLLGLNFLSKKGDQINLLQLSGWQQ